MNIQIATGDITEFTGDVIIIPCDSDLTYKRTGILPKILEKGGKNLLRELTAINYCEIGYAVIVQGYKLKTKNIIFMPVADHNNEEARINYIGLHQSLRAAFTLASLYQAKSLAIAGVHIPTKRKSLFLSLWDRYLGSGEAKTLSADEIEDIIISTSKNLEKSSIKELVIYKY